LLSAATFRNQDARDHVAQVDAMSAGGGARTGAGWYEEEHAAYGIPFPNCERFEKLEEQLEIITGLWTPA